MGNREISESDFRKVERRMRALLATIDYDFSRFTMEGFRQYVEESTGRRITFRLHNLVSASGGWLATYYDCDYVFVGAALPVFMQNHSALHEMSHILCNHPRVQLSGMLCGEDMTNERLLLRGVCSDEIDLEAETLASLIQEQILRHGRLQELTKIISSDQAMVAFLKGLELA
jgi:hypothetical protein